MKNIKNINIIELYKLVISFLLLGWAVLGYYNLYESFKNLGNSQWRNYSFDYYWAFDAYWAFGAVKDSNGTNPRFLFYGILIFSSIYLLSRIKSIKK